MTTSDNSLIEHLRRCAEESTSQTSHAPSGRKLAPECTVFWKAADRIEALSDENQELIAIAMLLRDMLGQRYDDPSRVDDITVVARLKEISSKY